MNEADFEAALDENPHDWECRRVYADWLDEAGETVRATGQRWQAEWERSPTLHQGRWTWWLVGVDGRDSLPTQYRGNSSRYVIAHSFGTRYASEEDVANSIADFGWLDRDGDQWVLREKGEVLNA